MEEWKFRPAADQALKPAEKLRSLQRETGLTAFLTQSLWRAATRAYLRLYHRYAVVGAHHLPAQAPFVMIANHSSHLDALALAAALPWRLRESVFPIAAGDVFFETPALAFFSTMMLNALPMWRKRCGPHALQELRERLIGEPAIFILFPEGTRSRDGQLGRFKPGLGMMIASSAVPVVPCYLHGAFAACPPDHRLPLPKPIELRIGPPFTFAEVTNDRAGWETMTAQLEAAVQALSEAQTTPERR